MENQIAIDDGAPLQIITGGLYSAFPIPAYQVLVKAREHSAKNVLMALTSHLGMGKNSNCVWPSITRLCVESGHSRSTVVRAIRTLIQFGFIKKGKYKGPNGWGNKYYFQGACYHTEQMNSVAMVYTSIFGQCGACNKIVHDGEVGSGLEAFVHYGCGGFVKKLARVRRELFKPEESIQKVS